ncbi:hypothetical protein [Nocardioides solisilvae]|uniref:hypothetical protein n=1 Tax=Nocardioides solisilvae TaxID=1542435 RepID=UPI000D743590|nr:hypothetical protein [Nocardioides solisilvae]
MKTTRLLAGITSAGLLGLVPLAVGAPAQAVEPIATVAVLETSDPAIVVGEEAWITGAVRDAAGRSVSYGTVTLYAKSSRDADYLPVETANASGYLSFRHKAKSNTLYKLIYDGGASSSYAYGVSESNELPMAVQRKVTIKTNKLTLTGKITPDFKKRKVVLKRLVGKKQTPKKWRTVKTNKKGVFKVKAPNKRGFQFSVTVPSDQHYTGWTNPYIVR